MPWAHLQGYICCALMRGHPVKIKAQWNDIFILLPKTSVAYVIWQLCSRLHQKNKALSKGDPSRTRSMQDIVLKHQHCNGCLMCQVPIPNRRDRIAKQGQPLMNPVSAVYVLSASTSLMVSISCLMTSSFFSCSWRNFARKKKPSEWKQTSWHRDSAGSWGLKSTCSTFPCSSCMFLRRVSMGASASAKSCWILIWRRKVAKKLDTLLVWIVAERNRTLERNQTLHQKYKFPEGPHWNENISTSTLHTLQIFGHEASMKLRKFWKPMVILYLFLLITVTPVTPGDIHGTFITAAWKKHPCWPKSPCLYPSIPYVIRLVNVSRFPHWFR